MRIFHVHAGLPKTGTSYLQSVWEASAPALAQQGLALLPGEGTSAFSTMLDLRGEVRADLDDPSVRGAWGRCVDAALATDLPRALLSQELLCLADRSQVARLVDDLRAWEVHLVVTVRDLATLLPSLWQQQVKARGTTSYDAFLDRVVSDASGEPRGYDVLSVLDQWREHVPPERTHVVTVPRPGTPREELLERACAVVGVDPATLDTSEVEANPSIGLVQAELLRRVNLALGDRLPHPRAGYRGPGKRFLAETILIRQSGRPPRLPGRLRPWVEERSQLVAERLRAGGYDVVGDLADLLPRDDAFVDSTDVTEAELAEAAALALADVLVDRSEDRSRLRARVRRQRDRIRDLEAQPRGWLGRLRRG